MRFMIFKNLTDLYPRSQGGRVGKRSVRFIS